MKTNKFIVSFPVLDTDIDFLDEWNAVSNRHNFPEIPFTIEMHSHFFPEETFCVFEGIRDPNEFEDYCAWRYMVKTIVQGLTKKLYTDNTKIVLQIQKVELYEYVKA